MDNQNLFPFLFDETVTKRMESQISEANRVRNEEINSINQEKKQPTDFDIQTWGGIGLACGFVGCVIGCINSMDVSDPGTGIMMTLGTWIAVAVLTIIIGSVYCETSKKNCEIYNSELESQKIEVNDLYEKKVLEIKKQASTEKQAYLSNFDKKAQGLSVQFAESVVAKEVVEWMTNGFIRTIDAADRRSHIEKITVPFQFNVYKNKITCNIGTYDFELNRCSSLSNALEQTALARAIAATIQLKITMKYLKDISGTERNVNYQFSYNADCPVVTLTYDAPNGNYKAVRDWKSVK